jgi:acetyl esterase/lipase
VTDVLERPAPPPDLTLSYGSLPEHVIDVRLPAGTGPAPLAVLFHGGFWRPGYDRTHLRPMAHALAASGYVVAVPEYRRAGMGPDWTATFDDVALACDRVVPLVAEHADLGRVTWAGHSAGGHLALWAAARPFMAASSAWPGACSASHVVSLAGCSSLRLCADWNLGDGAAQNLLGGSPDSVPDRYAATDPAALTPPSIPVTLVHGTADDRVPVGMSRAFPLGRLIEIPDAGHFDLIDPHSAAWPQVLAALRP